MLLLTSKVLQLFHEFHFCLDYRSSDIHHMMGGCIPVLAGIPYSPLVIIIVTLFVDRQFAILLAVGSHTLK